MQKTPAGALPPSPPLPRKGERGLTEVAAIRSPNRSARSARGGSTPSAGRGSGPSPLDERASRRQERAEAAGHDARADALGLVDQALAREPGLELRRRAALQEIAHGERVVERRALIAEHDVVGAGHAHHAVDAG